jgi:hypothetical protein
LRNISPPDANHVQYQKAIGGSYVENYEKPAKTQNLNRLVPFGLSAFLLIRRT